MLSQTIKETTILVDAHVHIYDCFEIHWLLDAAYHNFQRAAATQAGDSEFIGVLMLTESFGHECFSKMREIGSGSAQQSGTWQFLRLAEDESALLAQRTSGEKLLLLSGRQIVTCERIEVLALATDLSARDGLPLVEVLANININGGLAVLPWGVGKWLGRRGDFIRQILHQCDSQSICLGDIAGRPSFWPRPAIFRLADLKGIRILRGTDPLPLATEGTRPGSYGSRITATLSLSQPSHQLKQLLLNREVVIHPYGRGENMSRFIRNQLLLRYH
ncbi:MAG: hypothetical protein ACREYC_04490 [Gammaproteobacteria bacterium]